MLVWQIIIKVDIKSMFFLLESHYYFFCSPVYLEFNFSLWKISQRVSLTLRMTRYFLPRKFLLLSLKKMQHLNRYQMIPILIFITLSLLHFYTQNKSRMSGILFFPILRTKTWTNMRLQIFLSQVKQLKTFFI